MIVVFWLTRNAPGSAVEETGADYRLFADAHRREATAFVHQLQQRQEAGEPVSHVTMQSDDR